MVGAFPRFGCVGGATGTHHDHAADYYREALYRYESVENRSGMIESLTGLGHFLVNDGRFAAAAQVLGAASALFEAGDPASSTGDESFAADASFVREHLGDEPFRSAWEAGRRLDPIAAVDAAIADA